ncbi:HalOD1 output domain-containing protein [Haloterrigena alkaliphila]|uniref:Halobacterial output domain-containing protein n=1 Tax=Haloterrigena alkaliphila TaxID=2816475 RepID=A0A8A2VD54_9EURY|nr:HalOD1 output domain-containing protein [Haloterrigena alkaliphila]QSW99441.1 hypothetical protein J0X25_00345 [Haloterrigena alkaliphila]
MTARETGSDSLAPTDRFVYQADPDQSPSEAVIDAITAQSDADDPMAVADAFGPLYDVIDPAALDSLFEATRTTQRSDGSVSFRYAERDVRVDTTGRVELVPVE